MLDEYTFRADMKIKKQKGIEKVWAAIEKNNPTVMVTGIPATEPRFIIPAIEAGARIFETNHPALAFSQAHRGVKTQAQAIPYRYEVKMADMVELVRRLRRVIPDDAVLNVAAPGFFTEYGPAVVTEEDIYELSLAGADALHTEKSDPEDLATLIKWADKYGLFVDANIYNPEVKDSLSTAGFHATTPSEVSEVAKRLEGMGVAMIGIRLSILYQGLKETPIDPYDLERLSALAKAVSAPTFALGGINPYNYKALKGTGVQIMAIGTAYDIHLQNETRKMTEQFLHG